MSIELFLSVLLSAMFSGLLATCVSLYLNRKQESILVKRDVLRRLMGNRHRLTGSELKSCDEPFIALNEVFVVYGQHSEVISALKKMHGELAFENRLQENLLDLTKSMANAAKVPIRNLNDEFILRPFTPPTA